MYAEEINGGTLCVIDSSLFEDTCTFSTSVGVNVYADNTQYSSYLAGDGGAILTTSDGTELVNESLVYQWYYDSYFGVYDLYSDSAVTTTDGLELDADDDGDGYGDAAEDTDCSTGDSTDSSVTPDDNDADGICDELDDDDDDDGYSDSNESTSGTAA